MLLSEVVATSDRVAATRSRKEKVAVLAELLGSLAPDEIEAAVGFLVGDPRQGRIGVGWATVSSVSTPPAAAAELTIGEVDAVLDHIRSTTGAGSVAKRSRILHQLQGRATAREADFLRRLLVGELRQGALEGIMLDAIAKAADVKTTQVRRAAMLGGDVRATSAIALTEGAPGLAAVGLELLRPVQPMLASPAADIAEVVIGEPVSVELKLDGVRIQAHKRGSEVALFTRNLNDVTERLPSVAETLGGVDADVFVLDGELLGLIDEERGAGPRPFQETVSEFSSEHAGPDAQLVPYFFDVLHADGVDLIDDPLSTRLEVLDTIAGSLAIPRIRTDDADQASGFMRRAIDAGHEGIMVKDLTSSYAAGRRGKAWRKLKPVITLDLVVIAAEWGHGRRRGRLSNLHLGARDSNTGAFVMVGKTFKGLSDELLEWQTQALLAREIGREGITVHVRPELVIEIALDGVQRSTRYPGGVSLRFARVRRYRADKPARGADTIENVQSLLPGGPSTR